MQPTDLELKAHDHAYCLPSPPRGTPALPLPRGLPLPRMLKVFSKIEDSLAIGFPISALSSAVGPASSSGSDMSACSSSADLPQSYPSVVYRK